MNIFTISLRSLKKNIIPFSLLFFISCLVIFSSSNLISVRQGLTLWANCVIPSLFPFLVATELLNHTNIPKIIGKCFSKFMRPIFNVPGEAAYAFLMGSISGYPVGAKIVCNLYEQGICTKDEAERMIGFTNNSGPLFIIGTVGISLFKDTRTGFLLLFTHILSSISVGIIYAIISRISKKRKKEYIKNKYQDKTYNDEICFSNLGEILSSSILNSIKTLLLIGGFVTLFSVIISILNKSYILEILSKIFMPFFSLFGIRENMASGILAGIFEITNGIKIVADISLKSISTNVIVCAFLLGFGGFSVLLQVFSIISKNKLSIKPYIKSKILQAIIAAFYTYLVLQYIPMFNLDILF